MKYIVIVVFWISSFSYTGAQLMKTKEIFTHADTLRGSVTPYRMGWDVLQYDLTVQPDILQRTISGRTIITYYESASLHTMQIDLQQPLIIDSVIQDKKACKFRREENIFFVYVRDSLAKYKIKPGIRSISIYYHGKPREAKMPPWDGGLVWRKDSLGRPFAGTACQGLGASVWWPCKDHQSDEPDSGVTVHLIVPDTLVAVSNGRHINTLPQGNGYKIWNWIVTSPINTYDVTMNIGKYISLNDTLMGESGQLDLQYWVLDYNRSRAINQFKQVKPMLHSHEYWFGKYPFYDDGYKLIETFFLGMEHQSGIAYGNKYKNGYLGMDMSGSGWGLDWDYIIVHESGHEWFGNNITTKDIADMWVHEGFTTYSEVLFVDYWFGKKAGQDYCTGLRDKIENDRLIIGPYGVNKEGSGDMYFKGANMLNTIRNVMNNDEKFRKILRGLNRDFYHKTVTTQQVEKYISDSSGFNLNKIFDQYLRTTQVPVLEYFYDPLKSKMLIRFSNCVNDFTLPVWFSSFSETDSTKIMVTDKWSIVNLDSRSAPLLTDNYYITVQKLANKPKL